jgi:hypothetical protein
MQRGLPESTNRRLDSYALAAGAAGVSLFAMAQPAEAEIIFTPTHVVIGFRGSYDLDIDNDGTTDFFIRGYGDGVNGEFLDISVKGGGGVEFMRSCTGSTSYCTYAQALNRGAKIGHRDFRLFMGIARAAKNGGNYYSHGPWCNVQNHYLGLQVSIHGGPHYGWARMSVRVQGVSITALITGYAYETISGKAIRAGQKQSAPDTSASDMAPADPGTLGALAQGSQGLKTWRRRTPVEIDPER